MRSCEFRRWTTSVSPWTMNPQMGSVGSFRVKKFRRAAEALQAGVPLHEVERARVPEGAVRDGVRHGRVGSREEEAILVDARLDVVERHRSRDRELRLAHPVAKNQRLDHRSDGDRSVAERRDDDDVSARVDGVVDVAETYSPRASPSARRGSTRRSSRCPRLPAKPATVTIEIDVVLEPGDDSSGCRPGKAGRWSTDPRLGVSMIR